MKKLVLPLLALSLVFTGCKIDQTKEAKLPDIDIDVDADVEAGQLPSFDVDWADINVGTKTETVKVPKVVVVMEEVEVEVPYIDVDMPEEFGEKEERTLRIDAEVDEFEHKLDIKKIYANQKNLIVVAELEKGTQSLGDKKLRISDQVTLNAPDLNVKYYIVGEKPNRVFNNSYKYFTSEGDMADFLKDYKVIYKD